MEEHTEDKNDLILNAPAEPPRIHAERTPGYNRGAEEPAEEKNDATPETTEEATRRLIRDAEEYARGEEEGA